jgi:O-antigen ligase
MKLKFANAKPAAGVLMHRSAPPAAPALKAGAEKGTPRAGERGTHPKAYLGLLLLTMMLYMRPHELWPGIFLGIPVIKFLFIFVPLIYLGSKMGAGEKIVNWTVETKAMAVLWVLGVLMTPVSIAPGESIDLLLDLFLQNSAVFILLMGLIDTRARLAQQMKVMVFSILPFAFYAIKSYFGGEVSEKHHRIIGAGGGLFSNPNDLAIVIGVITGFAIVFALLTQGKRRLFFAASVFVMTIAILFTFSRGGFLGLIALGFVMLWKLGRGKRLKTIFGAALIAGLLLVVLPGGYAKRISTIFNPEQDETNSAQERKEQMINAANLAIRRPLVGVGPGNFHFYSIGEMEAHNAYLEIAVELGWGGLICYLLLIIAPMASLRRVERESRKDGPRPDWEIHVISVGLQASFVLYIVCTFFASIQYWYYLYYLGAFAVALRRIWDAEPVASPAADGEAMTLVKAAFRKPMARGALWKAPAGPRKEQPVARTKGRLRALKSH